MSEANLCVQCGAPRISGLVACSYCDTAYPNAPEGIECPKCHDENAPTRTSCARCGTSFIRQCIFCGEGNLVSLPSCRRCNELFEGADERKKAREDQARQQQMIGLAATGLSALAAAAASPVGRGLLDQLVGEIKDEIKKA